MCVCAARINCRGRSQSEPTLNIQRLPVFLLNVLIVEQTGKSCIIEGWLTLALTPSITHCICIPSLSVVDRVSTEVALVPNKTLSLYKNGMELYTCTI